MKHKLILSLITATVTLGAGALFLQTPRGQVLINCYAPFNVAPVAGGNAITCPDGEVVSFVTHTPTAAPASVTPEPSATGTPSSTPSVTLTASVTASATATQEPTATGTATGTKIPPSVTPSITATGTPVSLDPCSNWHPYAPDLRYPGLGAFDYGVNPCDYIDIFGDEFQKYLTEQNIDGLPHSSAQEEPDGYTWLYVRVNQQGTQDMKPIPGEGCALFVNVDDNLPDDVKCITNALTRVHMRGDAAHAKKRHHSIFGVYRVCNVQNGKPAPPCGVIGTGGLEDWGVKHRPYKTQFCYDETTPRTVNGDLYPINLIGQPPYVALQPARNGFAHQFISTITFNPIVEAYYMDDFPEFPNHILRTSWNLLDAKEVFVCNDEPLPTEYKAVKFILHAVALANLPTERPFFGYTTMNGYVDKACTKTSETCTPIWITADTPIGYPYLSYPVQLDGKNADGTSTGVIIQDFGP